MHMKFIIITILITGQQCWVYSHAVLLISFFYFKLIPLIVLLFLPLCWDSTAQTHFYVTRVGGCLTRKTSREQDHLLWLAGEPKSQWESLSCFNKSTQGTAEIKEDSQSSTPSSSSDKENSQQWQQPLNLGFVDPKMVATVVTDYSMVPQLLRSWQVLCGGPSVLETRGCETVLSCILSQISCNRQKNPNTSDSVLGMPQWTLYSVHLKLPNGVIFSYKKITTMKNSGAKYGQLWNKQHSGF